MEAIFPLIRQTLLKRLRRSRHQSVNVVVQDQHNHTPINRRPSLKIVLNRQETWWLRLMLTAGSLMVSMLN
jgi:hypothetical protein